MRDAEKKFQEGIETEARRQARDRLKSRANREGWLGCNDWSDDQIHVVGPVTLAGAVAEGLFRRVDPRAPYMAVHIGLFMEVRDRCRRKFPLCENDAEAADRIADLACRQLLARACEEIRRVGAKSRIELVSEDGKAPTLVGVPNDEGGLSLMRAEDE